MRREVKYAIARNMIAEDTGFPAWVPDVVIDGYREKGVSRLFDWQSELLARMENNESRHLVYSAPTSAGKSLVAELLGLRAALGGQRVLIVLPYVSMAREKLAFIQRLWRLVDVQVAAFVGPQSAPSRLVGNRVAHSLHKATGWFSEATGWSAEATEWLGAVCTTEKATGLINNAVLEDVMHEYGLVIVDELHMVADNSRGATLEGLIAKILTYNASATNPIKIIGMSATFDDLSKISQWLNAESYETSFRPIDLHERLVVEGQVMDMDQKMVRFMDKQFKLQTDLDCALGLAIEGVIKKQLTLVFCSSKAEVEKTALEVARHLDGIYKTNTEVAAVVRRAELWDLKTEIEKNCRMMDPVLMKTLPRGVGFHHAGLTIEERECMEKSFRDGVILVLVSTSTLSSGVNLPAHRVIIRAQVRGPAALTAMTYRQMAGRAGRMGHVTTGESYLAVRKSDMPDVLRIISSRKMMAATRDPSKIILESIVSGLCNRLSSVSDLLARLLFPASKSLESVLAALVANSLITAKDLESEGCTGIELELHGTQMGRAALAAALPPDAALFVFADLQHATRALALDTELHMLYLGCDWNHLHNVFSSLGSEEKRVAKLVGVTERFIVGRLQGNTIAPSDRPFQVHLRFFSALALFDLVRESPVQAVADRFRISRGQLQALQQQSATYAAMVVAFCGRLGWQYLRALLDGFAMRLAFGIRAELTDLVRIPGIDASRARIFHERDITSAAQLAQTSERTVVSALVAAVPFKVELSEDGNAEWLYGEERLGIDSAALLLIQRARQIVNNRLRELGLDVVLPMAAVDVAAAKESETTNNEVLRNDTNSESVGHMKASQDPKNEVLATPVSKNKEDVVEELTKLDDQRNCSESQKSSVEHSIVDNKSLIVTRGTDEGYLSQFLADKSNLCSTPISASRRAPRSSLSCSVIDDSAQSMDLFTNSLLEMSLDERENDTSAVELEGAEFANHSRLGTVAAELDTVVAEADTVAAERSLIIPDCPDGEVISLEQSLMSMTSQRPITEMDSFADDVLVVHSPGLRKESIEEDSFADVVVRVIPTSKVSSVTTPRDLSQKLSYHRSSQFDSFNDTVIENEPPVRRQSITGLPSNIVPKERVPDDMVKRLRRSSMLVRRVLHDANVDVVAPSPTTSEANISDLASDTSADLFESPTLAAKNVKRNRVSNATRSPSTSSPAGKSARFVDSPLASRPPSANFCIMDVCRTENDWYSFVSKSSHWQEFSVAALHRKNKSEIVALSLCEKSSPYCAVFIPVVHESFYGSESDEAAYPSCTPCDIITIDDRIGHLRMLFAKCQVLTYDGITIAEYLRKKFIIEMKYFECVAYLSFLAMIQRPDDPLLSQRQLAAQLALDDKWFATPQLRTLGGRIDICVQAALLHKLYDQLRPLAVARSTEQSVRLEMQVPALVSGVSLRGVGFDATACAAALREARSRMATLETTCHTLAGVSFNLDSATQVANVLFNRLGLAHPGGQQKGRGHLSTSRGILEQMTEQHAIVDNILAFRRIQYAVSHVLTGLGSGGDAVHCLFETRTATGRLLSHRPNVQNVPKTELWPGFCPRSLFIARPGCMIFAADYSQLELRVLAHLSKDPHLLQRLADDSRDFFADLANKWGFSRAAVKQLCYGLIYGMGAKSLAETIKFSIDKAQLLMKTFFDEFPGVRSYLNLTKETAQLKGYVVTALGRRRVTSVRGKQEERARDDRQSVNYTIQGTASEIFKQALVNIEQQLGDLSVSVVMMIHDEVLVECPEGNLSLACQKLKAAMEEVFPWLSVPMRVKIRTGKNWAELSE